ncbi:MAG: tRNA uridine-5-carboxymethylaminomethyl(34) synthesis GTPase MnmE [Muribaculaceae bacterium]|nr:tRNA uridine-5-carboxymethylaminomethyl(34) synthesis GTPase MnmE [Muribaculaceae bacterium]
MSESSTIAAISTPPGVGGIAVVRVSGPRAIEIVGKAWRGVNLEETPSHSAHLGKYFTIGGQLLDEAVATVFRAPTSFTGENVVEISVHGSSFIQRELLADLIERGARIANPGEFTQRAFLNGKMDLAQAEGVADLIASSSKAAHDMAINQTRGTFSKEFNLLRDKLIEFASLIELELDFSEEEVEFADRVKLVTLCQEILGKIDSLIASYNRGAVLKNGVPVVIAGIPNVGKSSLLNNILGDEKAIVTDVAGTTRDTIEDIIEINGILFRFIDTAGLRESEDKVERLGIERARQALEKAFAVIWIFDPTQPLPPQWDNFLKFKETNPDKPILILQSKADIEVNQDLNLENIGRDKVNQDINSESISSNGIKEDIKLGNIGRDEVNQDINSECIGSNGINHDINSESTDREYEIHNISTDIIQFSSKTKQGLETIIHRLTSLVSGNINPSNDILVSNVRHLEALKKASQSLSRALSELSSNLSGDLIAQDIREAISHLSLITGSISSTTLLHSIFSRFCIGK